MQLEENNGAGTPKPEEPVMQPVGEGKTGKTRQSSKKNSASQKIRFNSRLLIPLHLPWRAW